MSPRLAAVGIEVVHQGHQGGDGGVELHGLDVLGHLLDGLVDGGLVDLGVLLAGVLLVGGQVPHPVQEALAALHAVGGPGGGLLEVADEHDIGAHGVRAILLDDVVGVDHVAPALGHLLAALAQDHAVGGALLIGLLGGHHADVVEELVPEAAVQQVQGGVLHAAVVPVHGGPVVQGLRGGQGLVVVGVHIAQEVPAGARPLGHGVGLPLGGAAAAGAGGVHPVGHLGRWGTRRRRWAHSSPPRAAAGAAGPRAGAASRTSRSSTMGMGSPQ